MKQKHKRVSLGDIASISSGGTPSRSNPAYWNGNIPWVKTTQIQNCIINKTDVDEWITEEGLKNSSAKMISAGTILMAMYGQGKTRGQVGILNFDASINQACAAIDLKNGVCRDFVYQSLLASYTRIRRMSNTGGQENLSVGLIKEIPITLPPMSEQNAIADLLSTWDKAIEKTERLIEEKEKQNKWLLANLIKNSVNDSIWGKQNLGSLVEPITQKNSVGEENVLTSSAQNGLVPQLEYYNKSVSGVDLSGYYLLHRGDFAYNRSSANGYPYGAIKRLTSCDRGILSTLYICFRITDLNCVNADFLDYYFESGVLNRSLRKICQEGARSHGLLNVTKGGFYDLPIYLPDPQKQKEIVSVLDNAGHEVKILQRILKGYQAQKRGLMQKLLTGKWRVYPELVNQYMEV